jgi:hypothetical protein
MKQQKIFLFIFSIIACLSVTINAFAQSDESWSPLKGGSVRGNTQIDAQYYPPDKGLNITDSSLNGNSFGMNGFTNVIYNYKEFSAGLRFEGYLNPMVGFDARYEGAGVPYWFASYKTERLSVTAGHFYEQFGSGLIFRAYESWNLGYDNNLYGFNVAFTPYDGINLKGVVGTQRYYWQPYNKDRGIVRGIDGDFALNNIICGSEEASSHKVRVTLGGSFVSRYMKVPDQIAGTIDSPNEDSVAYLYAKMPYNAGAWATRLNLAGYGITWFTEYAQKGNDPSFLNDYIYNKGQAIYSSLSYSTKGLGVLLGYKWIDNMYFKSNPNELGSPPMLDINYLPSISKEHTYSFATMYPYATQPNGESGVQGQIVYTIPKKTIIGGRYGTILTFNYSLAKMIDKQYGDNNILVNKGIPYTANIFSMGKTLFFQEFNAEIERKLSKNWKIKASYYNQKYNKQVIEDSKINDNEIVLANIVVGDITWNITAEKSLRLELQGLFTSEKKDYYPYKGDWVAALLEFNVAPKWFVSVGDECNYNNPASDNLHYYNIAFGYTHGTSRITLRYGRQRDGLLCVGGVCRYVPQSTGLSLSITSSF